ncbi:hypothetical protein ACQCN2_03760 [Brevibacillus ginsengisoli]|uniref:hypothetical protein n=1 Tax=Brevibacillus ginsengisoli TaxID=363854 RepID=UPI003CEA49EB
MDQIALENKQYILLMIAIITPIGLFSLWYERGLAYLRKQGMVRKNYEGLFIPTAGGILLFVNVTVTWMIELWLIHVFALYQGYIQDMSLFLVGSFAVLIFGWQDDTSHDHKNKGLRGHLSTLWREQRMTSGLLKAFGILGTALIISIPLSQGIVETVVHLLLLTLSSNLINLFDVRPARAIKVFWLLFGIVFASSPIFYSTIAWIFLLPVFSGTLWFFFRDAQGSIMLGDTGANYLGFLLGIEMMIAFALPVKLAIVCLLLLIHGLAEQKSFSKVIQSRGWLNWLDSLGRKS